MTFEQVLSVDVMEYSAEYEGALPFIELIFSDAEQDPVIFWQLQRFSACKDMEVERLIKIIKFNNIDFIE